MIVNPFGGSGTATRMFAKDVEPLLTAARCKVDMEQTTHQGHAIEIAEHLDIYNCDAVLCISGDGVPHEVFNGLGRRPDAQEALRKVAVCQLPGGSGNAMCWNLTGTDSPSLATLAFIKGPSQLCTDVSPCQGWLTIDVIYYRHTSTSRPHIRHTK